MTESYMLIYSVSMLRAYELRHSAVVDLHTVI